MERFGFDMAFTAAVFLVLLRGMWRELAALPPSGWMSLVVAVVVYKWLPGAWYVPLECRRRSGGGCMVGGPNRDPACH